MDTVIIDTAREVVSSAAGGFPATRHLVLDPTWRAGGRPPFYVLTIWAGQALGEGPRFRARKIGPAPWADAGVFVGITRVEHYEVPPGGASWGHSRETVDQLRPLADRYYETDYLTTSADWWENQAVDDLIDEVAAIAGMALVAASSPAS